MRMVKVNNLPQLGHKVCTEFGEHVKVLEGLPVGEFIMVSLQGEWELMQTEQQVSET